MSNTIIWAATMSVVAVAVMSCVTVTSAKQYNVLYFIADDLRPEFLASYDQKVMITPNLDKLTEKALVFQHAYCSVAVCSPSRNSFMSGRRPHHTLVFDNGGTDFRENGQGIDWTTLPEHFKNNGYTTLGGGKTFHPSHPKNWDEPRSWSQDMPYFPFSYALGKCPGPGKPNGSPGGVCSGIDTWCPLEGSDDQFYDYGLANNTIDRLRYVSSLNKPWFVQSGFARPHAPWRVPKRFWDMYGDDVQLAKHRTSIEGMAGVAWHKQGFYAASNGTTYIPTPSQPIPDQVQRAMRRAYYSAVSWMDEQVGRILAELQALNQDSNTIVLLHGDHGWQLGEHNDFHKQTNFELATRVPLIIYAPMKPNSFGKRTNLFAELVDVYPTLAELAGTMAPVDTLDGISLAPAFDDPTIDTISSASITYNKTVTYTQYPGQYFTDCNFGYLFKNGSECVNSSTWRHQHHSNITSLTFPSLADASSTLATRDSLYYMGYSVRSHDWRYTVWLPSILNHDDPTKPALISSWDAQSDSMPPKLQELYDHRGDNGTDFDWEGNNVNVAFDKTNQPVIDTMFSMAKFFFLTSLPPANPKVNSTAH